MKDLYSRNIRGPLVSIIMNCYNGERYLKKAIDSVLGQTYENWELIFWDNRSIDSSANIVNKYKDSRIKYFLAVKHTRLYKARSCAIENSNGEFIAFLDVDDYWDLTKIERQIPLFNDPDIGLVYSNYWISNLVNRKISSNFFLPVGNVTDDLLSNYCVGLLTIVIRRSVFDDDFLLFDSRYHIIGDFDLVLRVSIKWKFACVQEPLAYYLFHGDNESISNLDLYVNELDSWIKENKAMYSVPQYKNFYRQRQVLRYLKGILLVNNKKRYLAFLHIFNMGLNFNMAKLLVIIFLPKSIVRFLKIQ